MAYGMGAQSAQYVGEASPVGKALAVHSAVGDIDNELYRLEELAGQLLSRISPLVAPRSVTGTNGKAEPSVCEFATILSGKADRIRTVADRISSFLSDLEF